MSYTGIVIRFPSSTKPYVFKIDKTLSDTVKNFVKGDLINQTFYIENNNHYEYRFSPIRIVEFDYKLTDKNDYREIVKMTNTMSNKVFIKNEESRGIKMNNLGINIEVGKVTNVKMSMYGPAFLTLEKTYISYNSKEKRWIDVSQLIFDFDSAFYKMPVAKDKVQKGDYISHNGNWVRVSEVGANGYLVVENIGKNEITEIMPTKNLFGFDFYTKLISFFDMDNTDIFNTASEGSPFGNILPLMMMMDRENGSNSNDMLPLMMLSMNNGDNSMFSNPLMMYMMMKDSNDSNLLPLLMLGGINK